MSENLTTFFKEPKPQSQQDSPLPDLLKGRTEYLQAPSGLAFYIPNTIPVLLFPMKYVSTVGLLHTTLGCYHQSELHK